MKVQRIAEIAIDLPNASSAPKTLTGGASTGRRSSRIMALSAGDRSEGASLPPIQGPDRAGVETWPPSAGLPSVTLVIESTSGTLDDSTPDCH